MRIGAAYIRVSTDDQLDISPESQLDEIQRYAKSHDILIPEEYIFMERTGRSGKRADNRPEFQRMIATAKEKPQPFEVILVWKFSRFARNQDESTFYKGMLRKKLKIDIESVSEPIMEGMYGRLIEMIIEWQDEFYSYNLGVEVKRGMAKKAELKGYQLVPPLGYAAVGNGKPYVIREDEYKIVEMIFHMYAVDRLDMTAIARQLNASGYLTRRGNPFEKRSIDRIIQNHFYVGTVEWNGFSFEGTHETKASVTELFEQCQERRKAEFRPMRHRNVSTCKHWLSGLMRCSVCGATLSYTGSGAVPYFTCWKYSKGLHPESCSISVKKMEQIVLRSLDGILESGHFEYTPAASVSGSPADPSNEIQSIHTQLDRLRHQEERARIAYENEVYTLDEYKESKARLRSEIQRLSDELQRLLEQPAESAPPQKELLDRVRNVRDLLASPSVGFETKGNALRSILKCIVFDRKTEHFDFQYYA